jgi:hypothetical protein
MEHVRLGKVELVYTRTPEGRKLLLRARNHSLSGAFQKRAERELLEVRRIGTE